jgi:hypothetical protein
MQEDFPDTQKCTRSHIVQMVLRSCILSFDSSYCASRNINSAFKSVGDKGDGAGAVVYVEGDDLLYEEYDQQLQEQGRETLYSKRSGGISGIEGVSIGGRQSDVPSSTDGSDATHDQSRVLSSDSRDSPCKAQA